MGERGCEGVGIMWRKGLGYWKTFICCRVRGFLLPFSRPASQVMSEYRAQYRVGAIKNIGPIKVKNRADKGQI